jgi:hypothetical protein
MLYNSLSINYRRMNMCGYHTPGVTTSENSDVILSEFEETTLEMVNSKECQTDY